MSQKLIKILSVFKNLASWIVSIGSLVVGILALCGVASFNNTLVIVMMIIDAVIVFLLGFAVLAQYILTNSGSIQMDIMKKQMKQHKETIKNLSDNYSFLSGVLCDFSHRLTEITDSYLDKIETINATEDEMRLNGYPNEKIDTLIAKFKIDYDLDHGRKMIEQYDRFLSHITFRTQSMIESYLLSNGIELKVSISIKQFKDSISYSDTTHFNSQFVYTSYRDSRTWKEKNRSELGNNLYTISKNTDFVQCFQTGICIFNNKTAEDLDFDNESKYFLEYYNSGATALITMKMKESF